MIISRNYKGRKWRTEVIIDKDEVIIGTEKNMPKPLLQEIDGWIREIKKKLDMVEIVSKEKT